MKHVLTLENGRIDPIQDLMKSEKEFALRRILVDEKMGGARSLGLHETIRVTSRPW
jgi:hypothetical protein